MGWLEDWGQTRPYTGFKKKGAQLAIVYARRSEDAAEEVARKISGCVKGEELFFKIGLTRQVEGWGAFRKPRAP